MKVELKDDALKQDFHFRTRFSGTHIWHNILNRNATNMHIPSLIPRCEAPP